MLNQITEQKLEQLGLRGMLRSYRDQQQQVESLQLTFDERLGMMVDTEFADRDTRRINRLLKDAHFREPDATIEDVIYGNDRKLDRSLLMTLSNCNWIQQRQSVIFTGPTGVGKSWLSCALGRQACRNGFSSYYTKALSLFEALHAAQADGTLPRLRRNLSKLQLLIIDDLGIGGIQLNDGPMLLDIIDRQSAVGGLIIGSQFPPEEWYDLFNDPTVADAVLDRIVHRAQYFSLEGESLRKRPRKG